MEQKSKTPRFPDDQPGFGPREIDPPAIQGYEPDLPEEREILLARQPRTDTMEAADPKAEEAAPDPDEPPIARIGPHVGLPQADARQGDDLHTTDIPADEPDAYATVGVARPSRSP